MSSFSLRNPVLASKPVPIKLSYPHVTEAQKKQ